MIVVGARRKAWHVSNITSAIISTKIKSIILVGSHTVLCFSLYVHVTHILAHRPIPDKFLNGPEHQQSSLIEKSKLCTMHGPFRVFQETLQCPRAL
jgi:hypothetical protein